MIVRASSWVIWSATVRVSSARKRQCAGSQKRTFCMASDRIGRDVQAISDVATSIDFAAQLRQSLIFGQTEVGGPQLLSLRQVCRPSCPPLYRHQHVVFQAIDRIGTTDGPL